MPCEVNRDDGTTDDTGVVGANDSINEKSEMSTGVPIQYDMIIDDGTDFTQDTGVPNYVDLMK